MIAYYDSDGRYLWAGSASIIIPGAPELPPHPFAGSFGLYAGRVNVTEQYHDIPSNSPVNKPARPSPNHIFDYTTKTWIDPRTLQDFKDAQWKAIKLQRDAVVNGGFTWDGSVFDSDPISQGRITGAVQLAQLNSAFTVGWTLQNNTTRTLNAADMTAVGVALGVHVATQFAIGQGLREAIEAATTKEAVEVIAW